MLIRKTFKYRLYPTREQEARLTEWLALNRELYNAALEERREAWKRAHKSISYNDQTYALAQVREARPEFYSIPIAVLRGTLKRLDLAFQAFFRRIRHGEKPGYPRFQGKNRFDSLTYIQLSGKPKFDNNYVTLPMFGAVKMKLHRPLEGTAKTIAVRRDGSHWYVCFYCEVECMPLPEPDSAVVGIDLGLEKFAVLSTGQQIASPHHLRVSEAKLKVAQQKLSRCQRRSHRRDRARRAVARQHGKIRRQRADFLHKLSRRLVNDYGTIVMEDLQIANLSKRPKPKQDETAAEQGKLVYTPNGAAAKSGLNKSIIDAGWGMFQQMCVAKAEWAGRRIRFVNPRYTSQVCSGCGAIRKKELSERWHSCECGTELDRDHNAAINILRAGERPTREPKGIA